MVFNPLGNLVNSYVSTRSLKTSSLLLRLFQLFAVLSKTVKRYIQIYKPVYMGISYGKFQV